MCGHANTCHLVHLLGQAHASTSVIYGKQDLTDQPI